MLDVKKTIDKYLQLSDWRVKENSTVSYSLGGLILSNSGALTANYWLDNIYSKRVGDAHKEARIHLHDLSMLSGYCFTGDTRVRTLDGKHHSFKELVDNKVKDLWVYSYDKDEQMVVPTKAFNPRITRKVKEGIKVILDNGKTIVCTKDHLFMLRDSSYVEAQNLKNNESLMPLYVNDSKYSRIGGTWTSTGKKEYVHRWVMENKIGRPIQKDEVIHHLNSDKLDNRPENLELLEDKIHRAMEVKKTMQSDLWKSNNHDRLVEYNKSDAKRREMSEFAKNRKNDSNGKFIKIKYTDKDNKDYNHKVKSIENITFDKEICMYDLTVPKYENFALEAGVFVHNCAGWSLGTLIKEGLGGIEGKITSAPAKHLNSICNQMVNFLGILQNEWAGAQAFSSFDTYLAPFIREDKLNYKQVKQAIESFVYGVNIPSRWGCQAPFSNITLDWTVPEDLSLLPAIVGGKEMNYTYNDCKVEMDMINKALIEVFLDGDANGRGFQYPIPTYSITKDFDWSETENNKLLFEMTRKYGTPYFSNYINSDMSPSDSRSMCCRLRLDLRELEKKNGGYFGSGENTGSVGVVTINLPQLAYKSKSKDDFKTGLIELMDISAESLDTKRMFITKALEKGLYPYTKRYLNNFENHFSTIGLIGMWEAFLNLGIADTYESFAKEILLFMRDKLSDYQEKYGCLFNLESSPAESTAYRLAMHDLKDFRDIITSGTKSDPYYTNSSNLPVDYSDDVLQAIMIQDSLQPLYTGGTVFHCFFGEKLSSWKEAMLLIRKLSEKTKMPYYTLSPTYSICLVHGYLEGEQYSCPVCGVETEVYSRITGYYRPIKNWNIGKTEEFKERKLYDLNSTVTEFKEVENGID